MPTGLHLSHKILLFFQKSLQVARAHKRLSYRRVQVMIYRSITSSSVLYLRVIFLQLNLIFITSNTSVFVFTICFEEKCDEL